MAGGLEDLLKRIVAALGGGSQYNELDYNADLIAKMIMTEAGNAPDNDLEMIAIANVVKNRNKEGKGYKKGSGKTDIEEIIMGKNQFKGLDDNPDIFKYPTKDEPSKLKYNKALDIAKGVLSGDIADNTGGATSFNQDSQGKSTKNAPNRGDKRINYGKHYFFHDTEELDYKDVIRQY